MAGGKNIVSIYWQNMFYETFQNHNDRFLTGKIIEEFKNGPICGLLTKKSARSLLMRKLFQNFINRIFKSFKRLHQLFTKN